MQNNLLMKQQCFVRYCYPLDENLFIYSCTNFSYHAHICAYFVECSIIYHTHANLENKSLKVIFNGLLFYPPFEFSGKGGLLLLCGIGRRFEFSLYNLQLTNIFHIHTLCSKIGC